MTKVYIKNMVCDRCKYVVRQVFEQANVFPVTVELGLVETAQSLTSEEQQHIFTKLEEFGFEILADKQAQTISQIKAFITDYLQTEIPVDTTLKFSVLLADKIGKDYKVLSQLFSESEHQTIEQYLIEQKIQKASELLSYNQLNISEIANQLGYSSVEHLSNQFKKVKGVTPSEFRRVGK